MRRTTLFLIPLLLLAAGCGKDSTASPATTSKAAATTVTPSGNAAVKVARTPLGTIVVDTTGRTLYAFTPDNATTSTCTAGCASAWPPAAVTGAPTASGIAPRLVTVIRRADGTSQIVVAGHPVYTYAGDSAPGDTTGEGSGGKWFVLAADGSLIRSATTTTASSGSAGGY